MKWFVRMCEIPLNKRNLLGRDPHPQEIFYYQDSSCDDEVDAQTILGAVQVHAYKVVIKRAYRNMRSEKMFFKGVKSKEKFIKQ